MKTTTKYLIGAGIVAAIVGGGIYWAKSASAGAAPSQLVHGHRYTLTVSVSNQGVDPAKLGQITVPAVQGMIDSDLGAGLYKVVEVKAEMTGQRAVVTIVFDVLGPTAPIPWLNDQQKGAFAQMGGALSLVDNGKSPAGIAGGLGAPACRCKPQAVAVYPMRIARGVHAQLTA